MTPKRVTTIPATITRYTATPISSPPKRKMAGYARVSTDHEDQTTSYAAQVDYYTNYIKSREDWEYVGISTDEGISATNTKKREGFRRMIADALSGKIDLIIAKSVSRFARNTVDSLSTIRKLKDVGCECYFEKENIWTLDSKGDDLQEEKRRLESEMALLVDMVNNCISENANIAQNQEEYQKRYDSIVARYDATKTKYDETIAAISAKEAQNARIAAFIKTLKERDGVIEDFDNNLWGCMVEYVTMGRDKTMTFTFRDGTKINV